jgi:DNA-binding response OmpR family regulator
MMPRVLLVEDDSNREILADILEIAGYQVKQTGTGAEAQRLIPQQKWDAVIVDLILPDMPGTQVLASTQDPTIAISASPEQLRRVDGAANYKLEKPFSIDELLHLVHCCLIKSLAKQHG